MTKQSITKILFTILINMMGTNALAYDFAVENADGITIYYNYINDGKELEVAYRNTSYRSYSGNVVIPEEVTYMNRTRKVTSIGSAAFYGCSLTSVTIPNSVTSIGGYAFHGCSLTSVTIPNSVTSIGGYAFRYSSLTSVTIPNSVTSIGEWAFYNCSNLSSVTISNSVTSIGYLTFGSCKSLTSVTIPNSVITIGESAFAGCSGLTSVAIPNSVTSIAYQAFADCSSLTSVTIPNSVKSIGYGAFWGCSGLISVTIGSSMTSIDRSAFIGADIPTVISLIENPFEIYGKSSDDRTFSINTFNNATLYVPKGTIDKYKATIGWKDFLFIEEGTGPNGSGETPETKKCEKPTISYQNSKLIFNCATEGATCQYTITDDDIKSGSANELQLGVTYHISVYATKAGYDNSEAATATLCWIDVEPQMEGITNSVAQVRAKAVVIQTASGCVSVNGMDDGTKVNVYDIRGAEVGSAVSYNGSVNINTNFVPGSIAIVKIGEKSIKVPMK